MPIRNATAVWDGSIMEGQGTMKLGSGAFEGRYSFGSRFEDAAGTNPEELIGAAHAGCYSMALSGNLGRAGHAPEHITTRAKVHIVKDGNGFTISKIELDCEAKVPGMSDAAFQETARTTKETCPVSRALAGAEITLEARLV